MGFLGFVAGVKTINKLSKNKKKINSFHKDLGKSVMFLSDLTVEIVQLFAKGVVLGYKGIILSYKGMRYIFRIVRPIHLRRLVYVYGEKKNLTVVDKNKYKNIRAYEYYPTPLKAEPKEILG